MKIQEEKCECVVNDSLGLGHMVNTGVILGAAVGKHRFDIVGHDLHDSDGNVHAGITTVGFPILKADEKRLREIRNALHDHAEALVVDVTRATHTTRSYEDYAQDVGDSAAGGARPGQGPRCRPTHPGAPITIVAFAVPAWDRLGDLTEAPS